MTSLGSGRDGEARAYVQGEPAPLPHFSQVLGELALPPAGPDLVIGLDADATLVHHDKSLSPRVRDAFLAHIAAGTRIMVVTGRGIVGVQEVLRDLGVSEGYAVCSNGAILLRVGEEPEGGLDPYFGEVKDVPLGAKDPEPPVQVIRYHTFDPKDELRLLAEGIPGAIVAVESATEMRRITAPFPPGELSGDSLIVPFDELLMPNVTRVSVRVEDMTPGELTARVAELGLRGVEYSVGWTAWLDVAPSGISKAVGLGDMASAFGVPREHVVAVGDSGNDCEMLEWAGVGVAMGNAPDYVKAYARAGVADVDHDGAAEVLEALL